MKTNEEIMKRVEEITEKVSKIIRKMKEEMGDDYIIFPEEVKSYFEKLLLGERKMSTECDDCHQHPADCKCYEDRENHNPMSIAGTYYKDECNRARGLLQCLEFMLQNDDYDIYSDRSHSYLIEDIETAINNIENLKFFLDYLGETR